MFDTHTHLFDTKLENLLDTVLDKASELNYKGILCVCETETDVEKFLSIYKKYNFLYCSLGIHPHNAKNFNINKFKTMFYSLQQTDKLVAIGETGLDFYYNFSPKEKQVEVFITHIKFAQELSLPIIIHSRNSDEEIYEIISKNKITHAVIHCFSGNITIAKKMLDLGLFLSFTGAITFKNYKNSDVIKYMPLEKLLVETDTPYLSPEPYRGKINTPLNLSYIIQKIAELKNLEFNYVEKITDDNAIKFFKLTKLSTI